MALTALHTYAQRNLRVTVSPGASCCIDARHIIRSHSISPGGQKAETLFCQRTTRRLQDAEKAYASSGDRQFAGEYLAS